MLNAATLGALFVGALVVSQRYAGSSPIAWFDTFNDEVEVQHCLVDNSCTLTGMATSVPGLVHAVGWLELRTLLAWLGIGLDGVHLMMQVLNALAVVLVFHMATKLGGRLAGTLAAWLVLSALPLGVRLTALYNSSPLLFLGTVFLLACTDVVRHPRIVSVALAALVGAVMANVHMGCTFTGLSVVWVALLAPRRRLLLAGFGAALFLLVTFLMAPPGWIHNLHGSGQHHVANASGWQGVGFIGWALFAIGAWIASLASASREWAEYRRQSQAALAVLAPFIAAYVAGPSFGIEANAKYLAYVKGAWAVASVYPLMFIGGAVLPSVTPGGREALQRCIQPLERILPFAAACLMIVSVTSEAPASDERIPTVDDLAAVARVLRDEHGWGSSRVLEGLKAPEDMVVLRGLRQLTVVRDGRGRPADDAGTNAVLMVFGAHELPDPLPSSWVVVRRSVHAATVLIFMQSHLDWSDFEVCRDLPDGEQQPCATSSLQDSDARETLDVRNMPASPMRGRSTLRLRLRLHAFTPGSVDEIFMPRMRNVCGGVVASVAGAGARVDGDRRHATLTASASEQVPVVELEWNIPSPECDGVTYDGRPPFVIEGDTTNVRLLEGILRKRER